jgi:tetratricopeptide (TPR) repeat protein
MTIHRSSMRRCRLLRQLRAATFMMIALSTMPAFADDVEDVTKLMKAGDHAKSLQTANAYLEKNPRDPQMRFLKGVILTGQEKRSEAISVFTQLTEDFPNLAEPYNNLAVLWASTGQYDSARTALEKAIKINPSYYTAYQNLGDIYTKLAAQAYEHARQPEKSAPAAQAEPASAPGPIGGASKGNVLGTGAAARLPLGPPIGMPTAAVHPHGDSDEVLGTISAWAAAWSAKDVDQYLGFYSKDFVPSKRKSRDEWAAERRSRIAGKARISVRVASPQVQVNGDTATVKFLQTYASSGLKDKTRKTMVLNREEGQWRIREERVSS